MFSFCVYVSQGLATQGWMMYYALALTIVGPSDGTPLRSLLSKCVEVDEYGKIFTLQSVARSIASLSTSALMQKVYEWTVVSFPGAMYLVSSGFEFLSIILVTVLYLYIRRFEKTCGPIGKQQDDEKKSIIEA